MLLTPGTHWRRALNCRLITTYCPLGRNHKSGLVGVETISEFDVKERENPQAIGNSLKWLLVDLLFHFILLVIHLLGF